MTKTDTTSKTKQKEDKERLLKKLTTVYLAAACFIQPSKLYVTEFKFGCVGTAQHINNECILV